MMISCFHCVGTSLVVKAIRGMMDPASGGCDEVSKTVLLCL